MNIRLFTRRPHCGSVLLVTLFMVGLLGFFLFSYLYVVRTQKVLVIRSQAWNAALPIAEAGLEEAMAQLNPGPPNPVVDRTSNGWGTPKNGVYGPMARTIAAGSYSVLFTSDSTPYERCNG